MKNFWKLIFIAFAFLISLCSANASLYVNKSLPNDSIQIPGATICVNNNETENAIVCANSKNFEIFVSKDNKETYSDGNVFKTSIQYKFLQIFFSKNYNKVYLSSYHKISTYLDNEICTRAP